MVNKAISEAINIQKYPLVKLHSELENHQMFY